jgi:hypothetical protein
VRKTAQQQIGHGQGQHAITEEFEAFVAVRKGSLDVGLAVERAAMGQRLGKELGTREGVIQPQCSSLSELP